MAHHGIQVARRILIRTGIFLLVPSSVYLILGMVGILPTEALAIGESSGLRTLASVAVAGCLMTAVGYWDD